MDGAIRYWAFLSYSHDDRRAAERLHRALESYRIPRRLAGRQGRFGVVPRQLHPIFRDRDELTASGHIGAEVEAALAASRVLIVLCSRTAANSRWVDSEIVAFRRLRPEAPVLCVLLDGEPLGKGAEDSAQAECLPPSLRARFGTGIGVDDSAPAAVDLRPLGDGWQMGVQKLVAGIAGIALDQLVQRDAQRRQQRLATLAAALGAIAIALGTMAAFAIRARDAARSERAQAESLIEFMIGDLRTRLEPVGRLDVLDAVGVRALGYYDSQDPHTLDANALGRRSRSLQMIGEIDARRGDMAGAAKAFRSARNTTGELLARNPGDPQRIFEHAQSVYWVGYYDWQHGDLPLAEQAMLEYQRLADRLVAIDPANMDWQAEQSYSHANLGVMLMDEGRADDAIAQFELSKRANLRRIAARADDTTAKLDLGQDYSWLSSAYAQDLGFEQAVQERRREVALYDGMLRYDPGNAVALERMMYAQRFFADIDLARGDVAAAAADVAKANGLAQRQLQLEPGNTEWQQAAAKSRLMQANILLWQGQPRQAMAVLDSARPLVDALLARDPTLWAWRVELRETQAQVESDALRALHRRTEALRVAEASAERLERLAEEPGSRVKALRWLALSQGRAARLLDESGAANAAHARWQQLANLVSPHASQLDADALTWLARAEEAVGQGVAAGRIRRQLRDGGYRHPDFLSVTAEAAALPSATRNAS
ncbi:MAG: toll/interleukin-1 receptor domain-containing protein [Luteimonas sp.]